MNTSRVAYLVSQYPAFSHTFILREVLQLKNLGMEIEIASINLPDRPLSQLTPIEKEQAESVFYVKKQGVAGALIALMKTLSNSPGSCLRGLIAAVRLGGWDLKRLLFHFFYWIEALMVGEWMSNQNLNHLHVHFATPAASVGMLVKIIFKAGFSLTVHGPDEFYDAPGYCLPQKIQKADFIICISHYARSQLMKLSEFSQWSKFEVCRLGVDPERFKPSPLQKMDSLQLLCVGRLTPAKGQGILLAAFADLLKQNRQLRLCLVGTGPDAHSLRKYAEKLGISNHIEFAGAVDQERILDYYRKADVFVLPSFAEGLPVVLMEAMAMQIPCVTTSITGIPELINDGEQGLLVAASDAKGLVRALCKLLDDTDAREKIGSEGRKRVVNDYHLKKNTQHLYEVFQKRLAS